MTTSNSEPGGKGEHPPAPLQCPYLKQACIGRRCNLYLAVPVTMPGGLLGTAMTAEFEGCALVIIAHLLGRLNSIVPGLPPPGRKIPH